VDIEGRGKDRVPPYAVVIGVAICHRATGRNRPARALWRLPRLTCGAPTGPPEAAQVKGFHEHPTMMCHLHDGCS